ncbi:hypothetical protein F8388_007977 [Cannabis sativa]|uniref:B-like cyclin n=1 Tax=Cannabis sativa TaxID=3483 RepID=A0A7J6FTL4_CANSA|nr:hypothetical protein F8388_007977 [Cannabis sativa]
MAMNVEEEQQNPSLSLLDTLYCEEEKWEDEEDDKSEVYSTNNDNDDNNPSLFPLFLLEQDLFWEDEELLSLFSKEEQLKQTHYYLFPHSSSTLSLVRRQAVEWVLKVNAHYGFTALTAVLAINYLDSDAKYMFEAKTIQRMELLVLSTLQWKMHPVTPLSFLDHIIRRLGLKSHLHWEFLRRCERLLLSLVSDSRFVCYLPSVLATATMMRVIDHVEPCKAIDYQNQLLGVLKINKEKVNDCYNLIIELSNAYNNPLKRKNEVVPGSPSGIIDAIFSSDNSNDSWSAESSVSSSPKGRQNLFKKIRTSEDDNQKMRMPSALSRVFVDIVGSPP